MYILTREDEAHGCTGQSRRLFEGNFKENMENTVVNSILTTNYLLLKNVRYLKLNKSRGGYANPRNNGKMGSSFFLMIDSTYTCIEFLYYYRVIINNNKYNSSSTSSKKTKNKKKKNFL